MKLYASLTIVTVVITFCFRFSHPAPACVATNLVTKNQVDEALPVYKCFVDKVFETLSELGGNVSGYVSHMELEGGSVASLLGISHILAITMDQGWTLSYPLFGRLMSSNVSDADLHGALHTVALNTKQIQTENLLFLPSGTWSSAQNSGVETTLVDFDEDDTTVPHINEKIGNATDGLIDTSYIEEGVLIPSSTLAIILNIVQTQLTWTVKGGSAGFGEFNQKDFGDMLEFTGEFQFAEGNGEVELFLAFQDNAGGFALRMPRDISTDRSVANLETMSILEPMMVRVRIPKLNYVLRSNYELNDDNETICDFADSTNMLELLDVLSYVRLDAQGLHVVSISGAQVVNMEQFAEELRQHNISKVGDQAGPKSAQKTDSIDASLEAVEESDASNEIEDARESSAEQLENKSGERNGDCQKAEEERPHKVLTFNRPFTWLLFDSHKVPIVAGVVTSLQPPEHVAPPAYSFLGMDGDATNPYLNCI